MRGGGGVEHFGISEHMGGKISMPPVVGVQIFSGTTHWRPDIQVTVTYNKAHYK